MSQSLRRATAACLISLFAAFSAISPALAAASGTTITGRVLDVSGGLPVSGASVKLERGNTVLANTTTVADGSFSFPGVAPGVYNVLITAIGYQISLSDDIYVVGNESNVNVQAAIQRVSNGNLRTIASPTARESMFGTVRMESRARAESRI